MASVEIVEVGPRDGLQNEDVVLTTEQKVAMIEGLLAAGVRRVEAVSFAHPKYVPQMADAEAVMASVPRSDDVTYIGLIMNWRGWERAVAAGVDEVNMPIVATDTFNRRNQGVDTAESIEVFARVVEAGRDAGVPVSAVIAASFGCPFEGEVPTERVVSIAAALAEAGADEIALADTIGVGDPWAVEERVGAVKPVIGGARLRAHFHDTRNTGLANAHAGIESGVEALDASIGGIGGCPFAPNATGNIATEDLVYMLDRAGIDHGLDLGRLLELTPTVADALGKDVPSALAKAGPFVPLEDA
jgi:hydroxymethylglutaryl-CoA lyase